VVWKEGGGGEGGWRVGGGWVGGWAEVSIRSGEVGIIDAGEEEMRKLRSWNEEGLRMTLGRGRMIILGKGDNRIEGGGIGGVGCIRWQEGRVKENNRRRRRVEQVLAQDRG
jgi:hypothetical protein